MEIPYLVRFGMARALGCFEAERVSFEPGTAVVVRTSRGLEVGEVVAEAPPALRGNSPLAPILRAAEPADFDRAHTVALERSSRFEACLEVFGEGEWPIEPIDAEPLLEEGRTVLHYLGPHQLDAAGLVEALRTRCGLDVVLEPVGPDVALETVEEAPEIGCGSGNCGSGGGCGSGGCSTSCSLKRALAARPA
jgi:cell fate regulator YaaT (PSP1 superfamily)